MPEDEKQLEPKRVREFVHFFKRYMNLSSVVTAALPIPITVLGLIPIYSAQKSFLSVYTSLFCFLTLGFIFFMRHSIAIQMFPHLLGALISKSSMRIYDYNEERGQLILFIVRIINRIRKISRIIGRAIKRSLMPALPFLLIITAFISTLLYHYYLNSSISLLVDQYSSNTTDILNITPIDQIPFSMEIKLTYLSIFIAAEAAFILMAIKEYFQDLIGVSDIEIMTRYSFKDKESLRKIIELQQNIIDKDIREDTQF